MMKRSSTLPIRLALLSLGVLAGSTVQSATVLIDAAKDNTLFSEGDLSNGQGDSLFSGRTRGASGSEDRRALLQFDLAGAIPAGALIQDADLRLYVTKIPDEDEGDYIFNLHRLTRDWGEGASIPEPGRFGGQGVPAEPGDATWNHAFFSDDFWSTPGGDFIQTLSAFEVLSGVGFYSWLGEEVVADVQSWVDEPATNLGWILIGEEDITGSARVFASRHASNPIFRPRLSVTYLEPWAGYPLAPDGRSVDTGAFLGWIDVAFAPWVYVYDLAQFIYAPEEQIGESGGWVWIPR